MRPQVVSFKCILKNKAGRLISQTYNRDVLTTAEPDRDEVLPGLSKNLQNLRKGETRNFTVPAEEAYGLYDPAKVILFPRSKLPSSIKKGELIKLAKPSGALESYHVIELHEVFARLDGNHPLAGQDLVFEIEALEARDATEQDLEDSRDFAGSGELLH